MDIKKLGNLKEALLNAINNPDLDVELCFDKNDKCDIKNIPYIKVKYVTEEHNVHEKEIDIDPDYFNRDIKDIVNFVVFQIQQFMEEIDSVEYGGE